MAVRKERDLFWALAAMGVTAIAALTMGLFNFAANSDDAARQREEAVIANGISARIREIQHQVTPNAVWDDAVRNLDNRFDADWAHDNVGQFYRSTGDFAFTMVLDADDHLLYAMRDGSDVAPDVSWAERDVAAPLIRDVREHEAENEMHSDALANAVQSSAIEWVDDRLFIITATLVQPDFGHAQLVHDRAPIILTGRELDLPFMAMFEERYLLSNLHVHDGDSSFEPSEAHTVLRNRAGAAIATLDWTPQQPGLRLLSSALPALLALLGAMMCATLALYVRARNARTRLEQSEQYSHHVARHDSLTRLPNRMRFEEVLMQAVINAAKTGEAFAVLCVDLDRFKEINDTYGHDVGDEALREAAARILHASDEGVCARLDGDGFAILLQSDHTEYVEAIASKVIERIGEPFDLSIGPRLIGCSVGIALSSVELFEPLEMLRRADMALFRAKADGRGCFRVFDDAMDKAFKMRRELRDDLRTDIAAGRLQMVYQPQLRLSGEVVGVESLVRWNHPTRGPISPSLFVPLAEETGLIHALGEYTLRRAAEDSLLWPGVKTAINVSATQLQTPGFVDKVKTIVADVGADPKQIEIELTEGVLYTNEQQMRAALGALHDAGFSIALDDFGTGYSSLSYLPRFPIDKIKIDRSFVTELGHDPKSDALFAAIVKLAQSLEMRVIAEGVETHEQWLRLSAAGCPKVQGYVASKPLTADDAVSFIRKASHTDSLDEVQGTPPLGRADSSAEVLHFTSTASPIPISLATSSRS